MSKYDVINEWAYKVFKEVVKNNPRATIKELFPIFAKELSLSVFDECVCLFKEEQSNGKINIKK